MAKNRRGKSEKAPSAATPGASAITNQYEGNAPMYDMTLSTNSQATMSSLEIAELTEKNHADVMRDIRAMLDSLGVVHSIFAGYYTASNGKKNPCFNLDRYHTEVLVTGYDVKRRAAVIKRWYDLESGKAQPLANDPGMTELIKAADLMASALRLEGSARIIAMRSFTEANCPQLLPMLPEYAIDAPSIAGQAASSLPTKSATALLKEHNVSITAATFNKLCESQGILEKQERDKKGGGTKMFWSVTEKGLAYGKNLTSQHSPRDTQPHWYVDHFGELIDLIQTAKAA